MDIAIESNVVFLRCADIERTINFYCGQLGLELWNDQGSCRIFKCGGGFIGFLQHEDAPITTGVCVSFNVADTDAVDNAYEKMHHIGLATEKPCKHPKFEVYSFFLKDPDGYTVEFQKILV